MVSAAEKLPGTQAVAVRCGIADAKFIENAVERGLTEAEGRRVLAVYEKLGCVKLDAVGGTWSVKYGAFWEPVVMRRALDRYEHIVTGKRKAVQS